MSCRSGFAAIALAFCGLAGAQNPLPPAVAELRNYIIRIVEADRKIVKERPASLNLDAEIAGLTRLVESGQLNLLSTSIAYYYRARAGTAVNLVRIRNGLSPDVALGRSALADYDRVLSANVEVPQIGVTINDALYGAGVVARTYLDDVPLAYRYWSRCAARGQAGCLNIMAQARLTGAGGVYVDLPSAIELHKKVYETGTEFTCAGAFSALAVSRILYFGSFGPLTVDDLAWLGRANALLDQLAKGLQTNNPCDRVRFDVTEYLLYLARGETRQPILERALQRAEHDWERTMLSYLLGTVSEAEFRKAAAGNASRDAACDMYFAGLWHAEIRNEAASAKAYLQAMSGLGRDFCDAQLALAKLKYSR